ncbi:hypothetical protein P9D81_12995 [Bacillus haynesii]|uniref:hypothetical protein n=1 Tax=Bacillus haynesii TaxID=1925021 RepID=UPI00227F71CF|nr:hypothetical protein [Bacillus haynesii]MCY7925431.1 hypothetical protein [Bacillus haynesii]MCY8008673.1 hypothetical protein [Bacillus haynesii]MCY8755927.1 hypothetical protein [Bacillus haynesii]MCY8772551.1 hypothetical protein [Bacillus haynesii]MCY9276858.1 hypothetical protein [Bacillus haynesii]
MKKIVKLLAVSLGVLISFIFLNPNNAQAATSPWQKVSGAGSACKVRIWTDATTYTKRAKTVDFTIEQNGKCGKLYYTAILAPDRYFVSAPYVDGYFTSKTPIKKLSVDIFNFRSLDTTRARVEVDFTKSKSSTRNIGVAKSNWLYIHPQ